MFDIRLISMEKRRRVWSEPTPAKFCALVKNTASAGGVENLEDEGKSGIGEKGLRAQAADLCHHQRVQVGVGNAADGFGGGSGPAEPLICLTFTRVRPAPWVSR